MRLRRHPQKAKKNQSLFTHVIYSNAKVYVTKKSATMKRLFGVKKTIEAPSLEDTTSKVRLLFSLSLSLSRCLRTRARVCGGSRLGSLKVDN